MATTVEKVTFKNYRSYGPAGATLDLTNQFTAIVGTNNTGKTTLLRSFWELRPVYEYLKNLGPGNPELHQLCLGGNFRQLQLLGGERVFSKIDVGSTPRIRIDFRNDEKNASSIEFVEIVLLENNGRLLLEFGLANGPQVVKPNAVTYGMNNGRDHLFFTYPDGHQEYVDWIPAQGAFTVLFDTFYIGAFRNAINSGEAQLYDMQVGRGFVNSFDSFRNGIDSEQNEAANQMARELGEIFGFEDFQVNVASTNDHLACIVNGKSYRGTELGAGITQFIIVAVNVLVRKPSILLIDEPELNLHASLQSRFLELLAKYTLGPVIYSTHSFGLARTTADEILISTRDSSQRSLLKPYHAESNLSFVLGELGYGGYQDTSFKGVLLVEGVTEVRAMKKLLGKFGSRGDFVVIPLGGDAMAIGDREQELAELRMLSHKVFAIVDSERTSAKDSPKQARVDFLAACENQGIECLVLERRALENYMDLDSARRVFNKPNALDFGEFDKPDISWEWRKNRNWRIVELMEKEHFEETDLGRFVSNMLTSIAN